VFETRTGYGIRWPENGRRPQRSGFATKTEARRWFAENLAPRLRRGAPSPDITFDEFCDLFLDRHGATVAERTRSTLEERLAPARDRFGEWSLRELEGAAADVAAWRAQLPETSRYRLSSALRQVLGAAVRWHYLASNPAIDAGRNPQPRTEEIWPFTRDEVDALAIELGPVYGPLVVFAAETGLRTNEWVALERRDLDRAGAAVTVQRRFADGHLTPYPKTERSRRRVPLTARAVRAIEELPPRLDTTLLFAAPKGGYIASTPGAPATGIQPSRRPGSRSGGPTACDTFATEALAAGVSIFELARLMGSSTRMIDRTYGHLARDSEDTIRAKLDARAARSGAEVASSGVEDAGV
jgi:integrase